MAKACGWGIEARFEGGLDFGVLTSLMFLGLYSYCSLSGKAKVAVARENMQRGWIEATVAMKARLWVSKCTLYRVLVALGGFELCTIFMGMYMLWWTLEDWVRFGIKSTVF